MPEIGFAALVRSIEKLLGKLAHGSHWRIDILNKTWL